MSLSWDSRVVPGRLVELLSHSQAAMMGGAELGPPWQKDHKLAMAAALAALAARA